MQQHPLFNICYVQILSKPSVSTMTGSGTVTRHLQFYFDNSTYIIRVEDTLYKLFHSVLVNESGAFAQTFQIGQGPMTVEGQIDEMPILINDLTVDVFDLFVELKFAWYVEWFINNPAELTCSSPHPKYSEKDLKNLLKFVHRFDCSDHMHGFITSCILERVYRFHPSERVQMGIKYKIQELLEKGFTWLCDIRLTKVQKSHRVQMGMEVYVAFVQVRVHLDEYTRCESKWSIGSVLQPKHNTKKTKRE